MFGTTGRRSFWWRNLELTRWRRSSCCLTLWYFARVLDFFHMSNTQCQYPKIKHNRGIVSWKTFRKTRRSRYCPCRWSTSSTLRCKYESFQSYSSPAGKTTCSVVLELLNQLFDRFSAVRVLLLDCGMRYAWYLSRRCRCGFPRNFPIRFGGQRIFLLLDQVDPVVHFADSA